MKLKTLQETRGAKAKEARTLIDKANAEKRALNETELNTLKALQTEIEGIDTQVAAEVRQLEIESRSAPQLSQGEKRDVESFDLSKVLRHLSGHGGSLSGVEAEMAQEGESEARASGVRTSGIMLPRIIVRKAGMQRRDMTATVGTNLQYGGNTIATEKLGLADDFYNATVLRAAGATVLEGLVGNLDLPRYVAPTAPAKKTENESADELTPETAMLSLSPNRLPAFIDLSDQLLMQSSAAIEAMVRKALTEQMLSVQEIAFFHGGGTSEPVGIAGTSGIGSVVGGTNGANPDWADVIDLESEIANDNALSGRLNYFMNARTRGYFKKTVRVSSTDSRFIWDGDTLNSYPVQVSNAVSRTLVKGSSGAACSAIFFGNAADFIIGYWAGISLEMIRDTANAKLGIHTLVASSYYDGGVLRPKSFAAMLDSLQ